MPPPLHTRALGTDTWNSLCGSKTRRSTTLLLGLVHLARKAHALTFDNSRHFRPLVLPVHEEPSEADRGHCHSQQTDARTVTDPIRRAELGLVHLRSLERCCTVSWDCTWPWHARADGSTHHDAHQLCHTLQGNNRVSQSFLDAMILPSRPAHIGNPDRQPCACRPTRRSDAFCSRGHGVSQFMHRGLGPGERSEVRSVSQNSPGQMIGKKL